METNLARAEKAYLEQNYAEASMLYAEIASKQPDNPFILINYGNTQFRLNKLGESLHKYYQAKQYIPRNKELNNNLGLALDKVKLSQPPMLSYSYLTWSEAFIFFLLFNVLFLFRKRITKNTTMRFVCILMFVVSLIGFGFISYEQKVQSFGVINSVNVQAYSGDDEGYSKLFELFDGQIVEVKQKQEEWSKIKVNNNLGWIKNENLKVI